MKLELSAVSVIIVLVGVFLLVVFVDFFVVFVALCRSFAAIQQVRAERLRKRKIYKTSSLLMLNQLPLESLGYTLCGSGIRGNVKLHKALKYLENIET